MAENREIILDVHANVDDALKNIIELQKKNEALKESISADKASLKEMADAAKAAGGETAEMAQKADALRANIVKQSEQVKANTAAIAGNTKAVALSIAKAEQKTDSLLALRKESAILTQRYQEMSKEEREAAMSGEFGKHLKAVNDEIREATLAIGNYKDNIGNYQSALTGVITDTTGFGKALKVLGVDLNAVGGGVGGLKSGFTAAAGGAANLGKAFLALAANPFVATVSVIVALVVALKKAVEDNATANAAWNTTLKALDPVFALIRKAIDAVGKLMVSVVNSITEGLQTLAAGVAKVVDWFGDLVGAETHAEEAVKRYAKAAKEAAGIENEIAEREQTINRDRAKMAMEVAELRVKAEDKQNYTVKQRLAYLDEAIKREQEAADASESLAELKLRQARQELAQNAESLSARQKVYDAEQAFFESQKERSEKYRELQAQRISFLDEERAKIKEAQAAAKAMADQMAAGAKELAKLREEFDKETAAVDEAAASLSLENQLKALELQAAAAQSAFDRAHADREATREETQALYDELNSIEEQRTALIEEQEERRYQAAVSANLAREADTEALLRYDEQLRIEHENNLLAIQADAAERMKTQKDEQRAAEADAVSQATGKYKDLFANYYKAVEQFGKQSSEARLALLSLQVQATRDTFSEMGATLMEFNGTSKAAFETGKAVSIATATVDTYEAATKAYKSLAGIPYVGPALGAAAAAASVASGMLKVKKIKQTKWNSGGGDSSSSSSSSTSTSPASTSSADTSANSGATAVKLYDFTTVDTAGAAAQAGKAAAAIGASGSSSAASSSDGGKYMTREDMVAAIAAQPAPVVSVKEISETSADYERRQVQTTVN